MSAFARRFFIFAFGLLILATMVTAFLWLPPESAAQGEIVNNVGTQGRALTPAGKLIVDAATNLPAVAPLTVDFVRSPDNSGTDGKGRFLIAVNSGFGLQFNSESKAQQTLSVIDLNLMPEPQVIQNVYFPTPNSANFGVTFSTEKDTDGTFTMFVAGGFQNRIWIFKFNPNEKEPISPGNKPDAELKAGFIDVGAFSDYAPSPYYNRNLAPVYPTGIALSPDNATLYVANNLGDSLGILQDWKGERKITRVRLRRNGSSQFVYPYDVEILPEANSNRVAKVYVSLWGDASVAVVNPENPAQTLKHIAVERHPTAMLLNADKSRLFVVNSDADSVSVIDTGSDRVFEKINVKLAENALGGMSPEGLALSADEKTLYVANSHTNAVAVVSLADSGVQSFDSKPQNPKSKKQNPKSKVAGFIPTGNYPSAVAVVQNRLFIGNGKGTGFENSSVIVNNSGRAPNMPNEKFPAGKTNRRGQYNPSLTSGNLSLVDLPNERALYEYTQATMRNNGLLGAKNKPLFAGNRSPFKHIIYVIRENRTYDQVFGDLEKSGDGSKADGDASVAIFGAGEIAKSPSGKSQNITPNARALALRFGLLDRFFVNAEASPDGHNWSTAAFSSDFVDKVFRWNYSGRGQTYDFEGFNRLPSFEPPANQPPGSVPSVFRLPATENDIANFMKRFVPYLNGSRDIAEPETLYLWDAAKRAGLTYRNYGEFVATVSEADVEEVNTRKSKSYPDLSPTETAFATKKSLEGNFSPAHPNFDMLIPDAMTTDSYRAAKENKAIDAAITGNNSEPKFRGTSRFGAWRREFRGFVEDLKSGKGDRLPNLSIVRLSNDHTAGLNEKMPTPQFFVAENDYALGRMVEEVSNSPYWKDTAIFVVEDDAQDGPDHIDAHRSPALVISAYNRKGALVHDYHNTVSLIRTMEICLGLPPMNFLDANAAPIDIFTVEPDLTTFRASLPDVALDNLFPPKKVSTAMREYMKLTDEQNLEFADMANPRQLNEIIWFSVRGEKFPMPEIARLPAFDLLIAGIREEDEDAEE
ncbi:MAG: beta-propeller fold lactonase family protein [Acidobacteria bacterium]|jgi:YVTN family beta-propeller protein|nr:beta-propeller fold lactonase family protein [Acidobacteriota bacterium]